ncbi:phosphoenolpyruvate carboxylase [Shigella flexneri]
MDELSVISAISTVATYVKTKNLCLTPAPLRRNKNWANCCWVHVRRNVAHRRRRVAARHTVDFCRTQNRLMLPAWLGAGTALEKWSKMANRASWKPCAAIGHSSRRVSACWRWSSPKQTCGWRNTMTNAW